MDTAGDRTPTGNLPDTGLDGYVVLERRTTRTLLALSGHAVVSDTVRIVHVASGWVVWMQTGNLSPEAILAAFASAVFRPPAEDEAVMVGIGGVGSATTLPPSLRGAVWR